MEIKPLGDKVVLVELAPEGEMIALAQVLAVADCLRDAQRAGIEDIVPGLTAVAVHLETNASWEQEARWIEGTLAESLPAVEDSAPEVPAREIEIPVIYGRGYGLDLQEVGKQVGLSPEEVVARHTAGRYLVQAIGFAPGFPYLGGLDEGLHCARRKTPRTAVPGGSVGIGGRQTGVYPLTMPGGWNLIGRTPLQLFDPTKEGESPSLLQAGDHVRFRAIDEREFDRLLAHANANATRPPFGPVAGAEIEVLEPGVQTTVQDSRRSGFQRWGVSMGGTMNARAARLANVLVGNPKDAAVLEWAVKGPKLYFNDARVLAVTGATVAGVPFARAFGVGAGEVVDLSRLTSGYRGVVAISGGIDVPLVLGSRSTYLAAGFGGFKGRALKKGDHLGLGACAIHTVDLGWYPTPHMLFPPEVEVGRVRFVRGPEWAWFDEATRSAFHTSSFEVQAQSNRMGIRLGGQKLALSAEKQMLSQPVTAGTVQVPPDGDPIVLMADRQSLGGYLRIANVIWADLPVLAELSPGETFQFQEVSLQQAEALRLQGEKEFGLLEMGVRRHYGARR